MTDAEWIKRAIELLNLAEDTILAGEYMNADKDVRADELRAEIIAFLEATPYTALHST